MWMDGACFSLYNGTWCCNGLTALVLGWRETSAAVMAPLLASAHYFTGDETAESPAFLLRCSPNASSIHHRSVCVWFRELEFRSKLYVCNECLEMKLAQVCVFVWVLSSLGRLRCPVLMMRLADLMEIDYKLLMNIQEFLDCIVIWTLAHTYTQSLTHIHIEQDFSSYVNISNLTT